MNPLDRLAEYQRLYPDMVRAYEDFASAKGSKDFYDWPDWCYMPLGAAYAVVQAECEKQGVMFVPIDVGNIGAVMAWRMSKVIYRFSNNLLKELKQAALTEMPNKIIDNFPDYGIYIDTLGQNWGAPVSNGPMYGFYAYLEYDINHKRPELRLCLDYDDMVPLAIHLVRGSLIDCIQDTIAYTTGFLRLFRKLVALPADKEINADFLSLLVSALLYLCNDNADIDPKHIRSSRPQYPYDLVQKYKVGFSFSK